MTTLNNAQILGTNVRRYWYRLKSGIGIGGLSDKNFFTGDAAVRFQHQQLPRGTKITTAGRNDGIGMQALSCMSAMAFAKAFDAEYVHTPFLAIDHNPEGDDTWVRRWEDFFGFSRRYRLVTEFEPLDYGEFFRSPLQLTPNRVLRFQQCWWFTRRFPDSYLAVTPSIRENLGIVPRSDTQMRVAVHVRRGDVSKSQSSHRYTSEASIMRSIEAVKAAAKLAGMDPVISLYSQGAPQDFRKFSELGCVLELDTDTLETMRGMIEADVLIMAKSSFSYVSALLNSGTVVYEETFNPPLSHWLKKDSQGGIDVEALATKFGAR